MAAIQESRSSISPEGLTPVQEQLAAMLFDTEIVAPVTRRIENPGGEFRFEKIQRPMAPIAFAQQGEFALKLHEENPDAALSPVYINLRNLPEAVINQIGVVLAEVEISGAVDVCAGIPKAGVPLAEAYAGYSGIEIVDVFVKEETPEGRKIVSGGEEGKGRRLLIVDDLATRGHTKLEAIAAAEEGGFVVEDLLVLVDRQQRAAEDLEEAGYRFTAAMTVGQLLDYGLQTGRIDQRRFDEVVFYLDLM